MIYAIVHAVYLLRAHHDRAATAWLWQAVQHAYAHRSLVVRAYVDSAHHLTHAAIRVCQRYLADVGYGL